MNSQVTKNGSSNVKPEMKSLITRISANHDKANAAAAEAIEHAVAVGADLLILKGQVDHGHWADFVYAELPFSIRSAQNYMKLAANPEKTQPVAHLGIKGALKALAEPKKLAETISESPANLQREIADELVKSDDAGGQTGAHLSDIIKGEIPAGAAPDPDVFDLPKKSINTRTGERRDTTGDDPYEILTRFLGGIATSLPRYVDFPMDRAVEAIPREEKSVWIRVIQETRRTLLEIEQGVEASR
jgi:hypothetical protein